MSELPEYAIRNREAWTDFSVSFKGPGHDSWKTNEITWGIWCVKESELRVLGNLNELKGKDAIELGCGTSYFSAWLAKHGMNPVGIDVTPAQLENAREFQREFGIEFPLIQGNAEEVPFPDESFDLALSEYGASIWCDPYKWVPEAARLLRPGGMLVFLRNSTISTVCMPHIDPVSTSLQRDWFDLFRLEWGTDQSVEFHLPISKMFKLLRDCGFEVEEIIDVQPPVDAVGYRQEYMTLEWARRWPSEEIWRARKK